MQATVKVTVTDVNDQPLVLAGVKITYTAPLTGPELTVKEGQSGDEFLVELVVSQLDVSITAEGYEDERCLLVQTEASWQTNNSAATLLTHDTSLHITVRVGIIRLAPGISLPDPYKLPDNPQAAFIDKVNDQEWIYRGGYHNFELITRLDEPIFGDLAGQEWQRFKNSRIGIELARFGRFILLEYGPRGQPGSRLPRFLIGSWVPLKPVAQVPEVVIYYAPPTYENRGYPADSYPFRQNYPYAFTPFDKKKLKPAKELGQPYIGYLINYLITGYKIVYQLLAAGRNPIVIMPSQPSAQWNILDTQPGIGRLIKEILRFLYSRQLVSSRSGPFCKLTLADGRPKLFPPFGGLTNEAMSLSYAATVSGFSAGINAVVNLCSGNGFNKNHSPADQGASLVKYFHSPPDTFLSHWRELWDIDGVDTRGWDNMVKTFNGWVAGDKRRAIRAYHSADTYRSAQNGLVESGRVVRQSNKPSHTVYMEEGHSADKRITWVHFSNSSLEGDLKSSNHTKTIPEFGSLDAHHFVPAIAFGHAAQFPIP